MLSRLANGEMSVADLARPFSLSKPAITKHLKVLEKAGLMRRKINGRVHLCSLEPESLSQVSHWLAYYEQFWNTKLDALDSFLTTAQRSSVPKDVNKNE
jgi:DNA-binding transcriptional ArsR family regulator